MAKCGHERRRPCGPEVVPTDSRSEASSWQTRQKAPREKSGRSAHNNSLFHPGLEGQTKTPHFRYLFTVFLEKCRETTEQPVQGRRGRSRVLGNTHGSHGGGLRRAGPPGSPQEREILSGGMNPVSPRVLSATRPSGRTTRWVMLPLLSDRRSQPSGGNCSALGRERTC